MYLLILKQRRELRSKGNSEGDKGEYQATSGLGRETLYRLFMPEFLLRSQG
jgi:hypothetical protein